MFQSLFTGKDKIVNCREEKKCDINFFALLQGELLRNGIMLDEDPDEAMYVSYSHKEKELNETLEIFNKSVSKVKNIKKTLISF